VHLLFSLSRCALCGERASSALGCCELCAKSLFHVQVRDNELALGHYEGALRKAVQALKYRHTTRLAHLFGRTLATAVGEQGWSIELVCAVPLHLGRRMGRGYNQAEMIAKVVARELKAPYRAVLKRTRATRKQVLLTPIERADNLADAFSASSLEGERVLLVDDVTTSGATATECTLTLLQAGASHVYLAVVASARPER
jgi:ComF family protein